MLRNIISFFLLFFISTAFADFPLVTTTHKADILILPDESECVLLAVQDFVQDVKKITGQKLNIVNDPDQCGPDIVLIGTVNTPLSKALIDRFQPGLSGEIENKWQAYRVLSVRKDTDPVKNTLLIAGSDERGTMYGIYAFCEQYLGVDPFYFWSGIEPQRRIKLAWDHVSIRADEPTFKFRGWFLNDEDLLIEWKENGGKRHIGYSYYHQVTSPDIYEKVYETMLRLQLNLVIPASFNEITNPDEERAIAMATKRGLFVSMHHIEPLGVSGYAFSNYWRFRGGSAFSIVRHPEKFAEVWRFHAMKWAQYPNVIWQLGLRGIADRPVWASDDQVPESDEGRGKLISDAIETQWNIVKSVTGQEKPLASTTLWMEGANLNSKGYLKFPP